MNPCHSIGANSLVLIHLTMPMLNSLATSTITCEHQGGVTRSTDGQQQSSLSLTHLLIALTVRILSLGWCLTAFWQIAGYRWWISTMRKQAGNRVRLMGGNSTLLFANLWWPERNGDDCEYHWTFGVLVLGAGSATGELNLQIPSFSASPLLSTMAMLEVITNSISSMAIHVGSDGGCSMPCSAIFQSGFFLLWNNALHIRSNRQNFLCHLRDLIEMEDKESVA